MWRKPGGKWATITGPMGSTRTGKPSRSSCATRSNRVSRSAGSNRRNSSRRKLSKRSKSDRRPERVAALLASMVVLVMVMIVLVFMIVVMIMAVIRFDPLRLRITKHQGFDQLAQGILLNGRMGGEKARKTREDEGLHAHQLVLLTL